MTAQEVINKLNEMLVRQTYNAHEMPDSNPDKQFYVGKDVAYEEVLYFLDSIKTDELPEGLAEAAGACAHEYTVNDNGNGGDDWEDDIKRTFIAGAEWMAGQGVSYDCKCIDVFQRAVGDKMNAQFPFKDMGLKEGDKVVVQIRKR